MNIYGIINGEHELVQSPTFCVWQLERYEQDGSKLPYLCFKCVNNGLIPSNGTVINDFITWMYQNAPTEI